MDETTSPGAPAAPNPAYGLRVTVDDYGRFLDMILNRGVVGARACCRRTRSPSWWPNQVANYDTTHDYSVGITSIPRYALGSWVDVETAPSDDDGRERQRWHGLLPVGRLRPARGGSSVVQDDAWRPGRGPGVAGGRLEARTAIAR